MHKVPDGLSDEQVLFLADILPTSYEVGVLNGVLAPGDVVAIVGAGPIGLAAILTARLFTPGHIVAIDLDDGRLEAARRFGADVTINNGTQDAVAAVMELTEGLGADVSIEAVGVPETFELAVDLVRPGGHVANVGVHGRAATLHLERFWIRDVTVTTGLVDTFSTPQLLKLVASGRLDPDAVRDPPVPARGDDGGLRRVRRRGEHRRAEGRARGRRGLTPIVHEMDDDAIRTLVTRLSRPHPSGGDVIARAAILAEGADFAEVMSWIAAHDGAPEAARAAAPGRGLHSARTDAAAAAENQPARRYVLPPGALA